MTEGYRGSAHVLMGGSTVPVNVAIVIDDVCRDDWHGTVEAQTSAAALQGLAAQVVLLEGPLAGRSAPADIEEPTPEAYSLHGRSPFENERPQAD